MNNEFNFEITNESKNAINEILKQQGLRHFKLYTDFYGELDVINYEEYQKLEKEKDKEIEKLNKENKILKEALYTIWNKEIDIDYDKLQKAINDIKNMQKEADKQLKNDLHKMIFGSDDNE